MEKKLREILDKMKKSQKIKIGCKDAPNFWYCGTVKDYITKSESYSEALLDSWRRSATNANKNVETMLKNPYTFKQFAEEQFLGCTDERFECDFSYENYIKKLDKWHKRLNTRANRYRNINREIRYFKDPLFREVASVYDADPVIDEDTKIIIIEGREAGNFWKMDEAIKKGCNISVGMSENDDDEEENTAENVA